MKIKFSSSDIIKYVGKIEANDYVGKYSLHRLDGAVLRSDKLAPHDMTKFMKKKADLVLVFPDIDSVERIIEGLFKVREAMMAKKGIEDLSQKDAQKLVELLNYAEGITAEQAIRDIRHAERVKKGRVVGDNSKHIKVLQDKTREITASLEKLDNKLKEFEKKEEKEKAEPA